MQLGHVAVGHVAVGHVAVGHVAVGKLRQLLAEGLAMIYSMGNRLPETHQKEVS